MKLESLDCVGEKPMGSKISRRKFVLAGSSLGSAVMGDGLGVLPMTAEGNSGFFPLSDAALQSGDAGAPAKSKVLVFDVNQTMLDLNALRPHFVRVFGDGKALDEWFSLLLQYSLVVSVADAYSDFGTVGRAVLEMLASNKGVKLSPDDATRILQGLLTLPPHPEVPESLKQLKSAGFRMVTLTNSSPSAVRAQLQNAGLTNYFEESISVEIVHRFKPAIEVYRGAAAHLGVRAAELRLIAAHAWDVFGAMNAGWQAAFVARNGISLFPLGPKPDIIGSDMQAVTAAILR
jgi:2-haloacid dehalogenase